MAFRSMFAIPKDLFETLLKKAETSDILHLKNVNNFSSFNFDKYLNTAENNRQNNSQNLNQAHPQIPNAQSATNTFTAQNVVPATSVTATNISTSAVNPAAAAATAAAPNFAQDAVVPPLVQNNLSPVNNQQNSVNEFASLPTAETINMHDSNLPFTNVSQLHPSQNLNTQIQNKNHTKLGGLVNILRKTKTKRKLSKDKEEISRLNDQISGLEDEITELKIKCDQEVIKVLTSRKYRKRKQDELDLTDDDSEESGNEEKSKKQIIEIQTPSNSNLKRKRESDSESETDENDESKNKKIKLYQELFDEVSQKPVTRSNMKNREKKQGARAPLKVSVQTNPDDVDKIMDIVSQSRGTKRKNNFKTAQFTKRAKQNGAGKRYPIWIRK